MMWYSRRLLRKSTLEVPVPHSPHSTAKIRIVQHCTATISTFSGLTAVCSIESRHWRIYHWATWAMPPLWAVDRKCSKLKISHTAVIAARVVKQRRQRDSVWFVHKTVKVVFFPQILFPPLLQVFKSLRQLNESSTASQEHSPTGSISNNCSTIDMAKHHVLEYRWCCKTSLHCSS